MTVRGGVSVDAIESGGGRAYAGLVDDCVLLGFEAFSVDGDVALRMMYQYGYAAEAAADDEGYSPKRRHRSGPCPILHMPSNIQGLAFPGRRDPCHRTCRDAPSWQTTNGGGQMRKGKPGDYGAPSRTGWAPSCRWER